MCKKSNQFSPEVRKRVVALAYAYINLVALDPFIESLRHAVDLGRN